MTKNNSSVTYKVKGMHCASCAAVIERTIGKTPGVFNVQVNYGTETARLNFDGARTNITELSHMIEPLGYAFLEIDGVDPKGEKRAELISLRKKIVFVLPMAILSLLVMAWDAGAKLGGLPMMSDALQMPVRLGLLLMAAATLFTAGRPYLLGVYRFLKYGKANMDSLIGIGTLTAFVYSLAVTLLAPILSRFINVDQTFFDVTIIVIFFISLGKYLEASSKLRTGDAIEKLLNLQAKTALVKRRGKEIEIEAGLVARGDLVVVKPGGRVPVDGVVKEGSSFVDESLVTGEPVPVEKNPGDTVISGTINTTGSFVFEAAKVGSETMLARIIKMVEEAQGSKAPIQTLADKISSVFVPVVLAVSFLSLALWLVLGAGSLGFSQALSFGLVSFVSVLVIACPCALGLATPTAIIVGVGLGAREGILIKDAASLEKLYRVDTLVLDKTGTITKGKPELSAIQNFSGMADDEMILILAALESKSEHPIAHAIVSYAVGKESALPSVERFEAIKGKGVKGMVNGTEYFAGSPKLMGELGLRFDPGFPDKEASRGKTLVMLADRERVLAAVSVADQIKPEAREVAVSLHKLGIKLVMLTGDSGRAASFIARQVGIDEVGAGMLPEGKLEKIRYLQKQGRIVAMAGDGVNDAPALAQADVGIAMATGTDVAIESAGITLLSGDISKLPKAIRLSRLTMRGIKQNLFWAFAYNVIGIPLAAGLFYPVFGWLLSPIFAGMAMALSSVSVVLNSLRIKASRLK